MSGERIDVLDSTGNMLGFTKLKFEVHRDGDWHRSLHVWIVNLRKQILIQKRAAAKVNYPGLWDASVSGHVSAGETVEDSAIRETQEEVGLKIKRSDLKNLFSATVSLNLNNGTFIENEFNEVFVVIKDLDLQSFRIQEDEVEEIKFIDFEELKKSLVEKNRWFVPRSDEYSNLLLGELNKLNLKNK